jgi:lipoprotein signal peptidase
MSYSSRATAAPDARASLLPLAALLTLATLLADVATKDWAVATVGSGYVELGPIALTVVQNPGLAFSIGASTLGEATILGLRLAALACLLLLAWRFGGQRQRYPVGFALVLGGGLGNTSDLLLRDGAVVDFISTAPMAAVLRGSAPAHGVVLNLADLWIFAGLALLYPLFSTLGLRGQARLRDMEDRVVRSPAR